MEQRVRRGSRRAVAAAALAPAVAGLAFVVVAGVCAAQGETAAARSADPAVMRWAFMAAAIAVAVGSAAAGIAVAYVGSAAMGAIGERPEIAGRAIIFVGLAEGVAIWSWVIAFLIIARV
ncbi:MAG: ATP synthase subunit C [bacterium]|nr:ATP synthase subunit C [bacterium]